MMVAMETRPPARALGHLLLEPEVARVVGVLPVWLDPMVRHLRFPGPVGARNGVRQWRIEAVEAWLRWHGLGRLAPILSERNLRWLVLRLVARQPSASLGPAAGVPANDVERQTARLAVHLITQVPYEMQQQWARARRAGSTDRQIAAHARMGVTFVRLVVDGIPRPLSGGRINPYQLRQLWDEGLPIAVIAQCVGRSVPRTRAEIAQAGDFLPARLTSKQIVARFGWTRTNVRGLRQHPHFPPPDGHPTGATMGKGTWWWAATIDQWEAGTKLRRCRVCGARVQRLGTHQTKHQLPKRPAVEEDHDHAQDDHHPH
ncbi:hypothetical protein BA895_22520 [Humibacillus sp. DSM 29435]|uniref:hypothetical protein n=1 Tax=Humibacillus sp. DSM 29435 TaxID=1869167 RepID=UPI000872A974|nr:hypothetical protein [Humibacillus sp. DSM 29435]OFE15544.1 hypothetical protein BA895_22520 [Humibacillus sp. DSM 29435]